MRSPVLGVLIVSLLVICAPGVGADDEKTKKGEDRATVKLPREWPPLQVSTGRVDGRWYLIRLPGH